MTPDTVHEFWFGDATDWLECVTRNQQRWFERGQELDAPVREQFATLVLAVAGGEYDQWLDTPRGAIALILTLDQFPRHIYRGTAQAFDFDRKALQLCQLGIERGVNEQLAAVERSFFYLPLEHSEDLGAQQQGVALMQANARSGPPQLRDYLENSARYGEAHRDIIAQFGRFPHRNSVLDRASTEQEAAYLNAGAERFGQ